MKTMVIAFGVFYLSFKRFSTAENYGTETTKTEIGMKSKPCYGMETAAKTDISLDSNPCYGTGSAIHESPI